MCHYSTSNKYAKDILDKIPYIPHELIKNYDFREKF